jgi:hypothetical protein
MEKIFLVKTTTDDTDYLLTQYGIVIISEETQKNIKDAMTILRAEKRFKGIILTEGLFHAFKDESMAEGTSMVIDAYFKKDKDFEEISKEEMEGFIKETDDCAGSCNLIVHADGNIEAYAFSTGSGERIESSEIKMI